MIPTAGFKPICLVLHDEQQSQIIKMLTVNAKLLDYGYERDKRKPQKGSRKTWQNLAVYWKFSWNSFSFVDRQVISSLLLGYQMLKSFPFCLAKTEKKATSLQITLKQFTPFYKGL